MRRMFWFIMFYNEELKEGQAVFVQGGRKRRAVIRARGITCLGKGWKVFEAYRSTVMGWKYKKAGGKRHRKIDVGL